MTNEELEQLSKEELVLRVAELEAVLSEFQESSKELESVLEEELQGLEKANTTLQTALEMSKENLQKANSKVMSLTREINELQETSSFKLKEQDEIITQLKQKLVHVEITNDSMESNDRMLTSKLELANQFNSELLEKLALVENDYERERKAGMEKQLYISNYQNQVKELQQRVEELDIHGSEVVEPDSSMLSLGAVLKEGPPIEVEQTANYPKGTLKKSNSLQGIKNLNEGVQAYILSTSSKSLQSPSSAHFFHSAQNSPTVALASSERPRSLSSSSQSYRRLNQILDNPNPQLRRSSDTTEIENKPLRHKSSKDELHKRNGLPLSTIEGSPNIIRKFSFKDKPKGNKKIDLYNS
ncbi:uncharacterized protein RJT20DRAFT_128176 [Scheffersomyces xylosifermentans]|uniref:uncharacterized protein n=1 Tax=Scheffersomyces xylosifermentans TaxID=1304137 RepID=UPI00315CE20B